MIKLISKLFKLTRVIHFDFQSSVCQRIVEEIKSDHSTRSNSIYCLSTDLFYRDLTTEESELAKTGNFNFDHPGALSIVILVQLAGSNGVKRLLTFLASLESIPVAFKSFYTFYGYVMVFVELKLF